VRNPPAAPLARLSSHGSNCPVPVLDCAGGSWMERDRPRPRGRSVGMRKTADRELGCARVDRLWRGKIDRGCHARARGCGPLGRGGGATGAGRLSVLGRFSDNQTNSPRRRGFFFRLCMARSMNPSPSATCANGVHSLAVSCRNIGPQVIANGPSEGRPRHPSASAHSMPWRTTAGAGDGRYEFVRPAATMARTRVMLVFGFVGIAVVAFAAGWLALERKRRR
jgi:hypothetical protein